MADEAKSNSKPKSKNSKMKKRKLEQTSEEIPCTSKTYTHEVCKKAKTPTESEDSIPKPASSRPWRNFQLIFALQNKEIELQKKIEMTLDYVKSVHKEEGNNTNQVSEMVKLPRLLFFLNDWIQSLLISSGNRGNIHGDRYDWAVESTYLDIRCWEIFKFCMEKSANLKVALNFSRNILRPIQFVALHALCQLNDVSLHTKQPFNTSADFEICGVVADCFYLLYSAHDGTSKENLELWLSTVNAVVELINKIFLVNLDGEKAGLLIIRFSCLVLEPFAKFLRIHPTRKTGFGDFIHKLLEPLLRLLGFLHLHIEGSNSAHVSNLLKLVGEVLSQGVFHLIHMDGFLTLHSVDKYHPANDGKSEDLKTIIKSYHRHLFEELQKILAGRNMLAINGVGELVRLLVDQVKKCKGAAMLPDGTRVSINKDSKGEEDNIGNKSISLASRSSAFQNNGYCINLNVEARKALFDFFVQIIEPVLVKLNGYPQEHVEVGQMVDIHCSLKFINKVFSSLMRERIYIRTEDISEGACLGFLRKVYDTISKFSFKSNFFWLSRHQVEIRLHLEMSSAVSMELVVALGCLLEIEYEVLGNDLVGLWHLLLSHLAVGISMRNSTDTVSLINKTFDTACQLINLFAELRQVKGAFFALCESIRLFGTFESDGSISPQLIFGSSTSSYEASVKSVLELLSFPGFKITAHNAISSIPEGQVSGFIQHLAEDLRESLKWLRLSCSKSIGNVSGEMNVRCSIQDMNLHVELLGKCLSELYTIVLDSLIVNASNSVMVGSSIKNLMSVLHPTLRTLVELSRGSINRFLYTISGGSFGDDFSENIKSLMQHEVPNPWAFIFFFRLYMSCRSLHRRIISLVPPSLSRKMSASMGDLCTAYSGKDWTEKTDCADEGYFSWIVKPSAPLLSVIRSISDIYLQNDDMDLSCLVYVLHSMALQRLADLNRQIKSAEYVLQETNNMVQSELLDDAGQLKQRKKCRKWERSISHLRKEATGLTDYMMSSLFLIADDPLFSGSDVFNGCCHCLCGESEWDLGVCSLNKRSFPIAIWWNLSQNVELWCIHAGKKILKMFLCLLIRSSIPSMKRDSTDLAVSTNSKQQMKVTVHQTSTELLCDSTFYEFKFVRRYLASRFCHILKLAVTSSDALSSSDIELSSSPDWSVFLAALENSLAVSLIEQGNMEVANHNSYSLNELDKELCNGQEAFHQDGMKYAACKNLLDFLCWMPKEHLNSRSFMLYATNVLNLERLAVSNLVDCPARSPRDDASELIKFLLSCQKALKHLVVLSCNENSGVRKSSKSSVLSDASFLMLWIMKSVYMVAGIQDVIRQDQSDRLTDVIFSLIDHTSFIFLTLSKHYFHQMIFQVGCMEKLCKDQCNPVVDHEESSLVESDLLLDSSGVVEASDSVYNVAQGIKEELQNLLSSLEDSFSDRRMDSGCGYADLSKLTSLVACFSGFICGLASALSQVDGKDSDDEGILSRWKCGHISKLDQYINVFPDVIHFFIQNLLMEDKQQQIYLGDEQTKNMVHSDRDLLGVKQFPLGNGFLDTDMSSGGEQRKGIVAAYLESSHIASDCFTAYGLQQKLLTQGATNVARVSTEANSHGLLRLNRHLLRQLLKGDFSEVAFLLRHILIGSSAILRLNLLVGTAGLSSTMIGMFVEISHFLICEFAKADNIQQPFSFVWLDGVLKYLEELGSHFSLTNPALSRYSYAKLVELHIMAIGKCITLGGKKFKLTSHGIGSNTKIFDNIMRLKRSADCQWLFSLEEFKVRLRTSFKVLVKKASELHLLSAVQAVERALVGVEEGFTAFYGINTGGTEGGMVSPYVAAGVDCLDLLLENVSGRKRLNVVRRHMHSFLAGLFNIILHVQSPSIFCDRLHGKLCDGPDPGSVVLMCIEVLIRISGKHALFQMEFWHVVHSLHIPASLFQCFSHLRLCNYPTVSGDGSAFDSLHCDPAMRIDWQFSVELYATCCRLLRTVLKHHKSESERCIALLQESVSVLLYHLETVDADLVVKKGYLPLKVQDGVKCASSLRRIYEEMKQQKDTFGPHCFKFLSTYIAAYSGYGPLKSGIRREIDEALKPGVHALIDSCSSEDLQYLHTVFGEGPCRNTLANLQQDYKLNFQYEGKV